MEKMKKRENEVDAMNENEWSKSWQHHLEEYLARPARTGIFVYRYCSDISTALEIACGSSRDSIYLAHKGIKSTASDYNAELIAMLRERFTYDNLSYIETNAFNLPFEDNTFDVTFHNGFFIYFSSDDDICLLLREQYRVSKKYILFFVHNKLNDSLVRRFKKLALNDPIYDARFFTPSEVEDIVHHAGIGYDSLKILKFGGPIDLLYNKRVKRIIPNIFYPFRESIIPKLYQLQPWGKTERVACLIHLKK